MGGATIPGVSEQCGVSFSSVARCPGLHRDRGKRPWDEVWALQGVRARSARAVVSSFEKQSAENKCREGRAGINERFTL